MSIRFHKSIKICKGVKVNFSKRGVSTSFGGKGFSFNTGTRGSSATFGIPGTGLSTRVNLTGGSSRKSSSSRSSSSRSTNTYTKSTYTPQPEPIPVDIKIQHYDDGSVKFFTANDVEITDPTIIAKIKSTSAYKESARKAKEDMRVHNEQEVAHFNQDAADIIEMYKHSTMLYSETELTAILEKLSPKTYTIQSFEEQTPSDETIRSILESEAKNRFATWMPWKFGEVKKQRETYISDNTPVRLSEAIEQWSIRKKLFDDEQIAISERVNAEYMAEYEANRRGIQNLMSADEEYITEAIDDWLSTVELTLDFSVSYKLLLSKGTLAIDIDLPEIEDIPYQKAKQLANGTMKIVDKTQKELNADYQECVFGMAAFLASHMSNVSTAIKTIIVSGYTQRRNSKTGDIQDDYVYSIIFKREKWNVLKRDSETGKDFCLKFENRSNILAGGKMKTIIPIEIED